MYTGVYLHSTLVPTGTIPVEGKSIKPLGSYRQLGNFRQTIGGSKGEARDAPGGPNSFIFMQFSAKNCKIIALLGVGAPPSVKYWIRHCKQQKTSKGRGLSFEQIYPP